MEKAVREKLALKKGLARSRGRASEQRFMKKGERLIDRRDVVYGVIRA